MILTVFFGKSKPINFILIAILGIVYLILALEHQNNTYELIALLPYVLSLVCYGLLIFTTNFVAKRNELSKSNTYVIFVASTLIALLFTLRIDTAVLVATLLVLLGFRRIISLRSQKNIQKKILDSTLWFGLATCIYIWSFIFFAVLLVGIALFAAANYRNWLIPVVGIFAIFLFINCYHLLRFDQFFDLGAALANVKISVWTFFSIPTTFLYGWSIFWSILFFTAYFINYKQKKAKITATFNLMLVYFLAAFLLILVVPNKSGSELLFLAVPTVLISASFFRGEKLVWLKEIVLWLFLLAPFALRIFLNQL